MTGCCRFSSLISIHALREESDHFDSGFSFSYGLFQSTPSARRATVWYRSNTKQEVISIHALREESDVKNFGGVYANLNFNPRPPRGERHRVDLVLS